MGVINLSRQPLLSVITYANTQDTMKPIFSRGPFLQLRLCLAVVLAVLLILMDSYVKSFIQIRSYLDTAIYPLQFFSDGPRRVLDDISKRVASREQLVKENEMLQDILLFKDSEILRLDHYKNENARLRELLGSPLRHDELKIVTQVISTAKDPYSNQIVIDKGSAHGVYEGQAVISDKGVVGQVVAVSKITSRVLLICDASHSLPIQVLRNDIRVIATGNGCSEELQLEYLPTTTDIRVGDILVTSGLGGHFPEGYPVAVVSSVNVDNQHAYTLVKAKPMAELGRLRYLLLLWGDDNGAAQPVSPNEVHRIANERLMNSLPQVEAPDSTYTSPATEKGAP